MSICKCPKVPAELQETLVSNLLNDHEWSLLSLQDMANAGNSLEDITQVVPFRGEPCKRSLKCCGQCTRQCTSRCIQDCLHRLYMWRKLYENTPATERDMLPLGIRMIVVQHFSSHEELSWAVGDLISRKTNSELKEYMDYAELRSEENPYKIDYAPQVEIDPDSGKRVVNPVTGELHILEWPRTGLCPFCLPKVTVDRRFTEGGNARRT